MKRSVATIGAAVIPALLLGCGGPRADHQPWEGALPRPGTGGPVWLVGVDGATWDLMQPLLDDGALPHLAGLIERGVHGTLRSEEPMISPALWATIATGVPRAVHGIENFVVKLPRSYEEAEAGPPDRRWPAVWELVDAAGGESLVVSWFGSYPAEPIGGAYVSKGFDPASPHPGQVEPAALADWLAANTRVAMPRAALEQIGRSDYLRQHLLEDARTLAVFEALLERLKPDFSAVYLSGIDVVQHVTWMHMDPTYEPFPGDPPRRDELAGVIPAYYRFVDWAVGRIAARAPDNATIVIVSDHGAGPMEPQRSFHFRLDVLLERLGYTRRVGDRTDWSATTAFTISELHRHDKHVWLNVEGVEARGIVPPERAGEVAGELRRRLAGLTTGDGAPLLERVVVHCDEPGWVPGEPALTVRFSAEALWAPVARDGSRELNMADVRLRHRDVSGDHRLEGVVVAAGPAVRGGKLERPLTIYDVAPTLLYLLGLPQDARTSETAPPGGGVARSMILPEHLARNPVRVVESYPGTDRGHLGRRPSAAVEAADPAHEAAMDKLRSLGYVN